MPSIAYANSADAPYIPSSKERGFTALDDKNFSFRAFLFFVFLSITLLSHIWRECTGIGKKKKRIFSMICPSKITILDK